MSNVGVGHNYHMPLIVEKLESAKRYIPNLRIVSEHVVRGGQPDPEGIRCLHEAGVRAIVNLCGASSLVSLFRPSSASSCAESPEVAEERAVAQKVGLQFISIPLDVFRSPNDQALHNFVDVVMKDEHRPIFVHCLHGRDRTGLMTALYRVACDGWTADKAYAEMVECGFDTGFTHLSDALFAYAKKRV